jgi:hypothetical protein
MLNNLEISKSFTEIMSREKGVHYIKARPEGSHQLSVGTPWMRPTWMIEKEPSGNI